MLDGIRMPQNLIILPVAAQVFLTFAVLIVLGLRRHASMRAEGKRPDDLGVIVEDSAWQRPAELASRNFKNQFELPVLFYAVCAFLLITRTVDAVHITLALVFVASRIVHAVLHLSGARVMRRGTAYLVGLLALALMWVWLVWQIGSNGLW